MEATPALQLETLYVLDARGRILSNREPPPASPAPVFSLIRGASGCAWAVRADVPAAAAHELERLARQEPPAPDPHTPPVHADRYRALAGGRVEFGPAFAFPDVLPAPGEVAVIDDEQRLQRLFRGWRPGDIAGGRAPVLAGLAGGEPVSVCFCARKSGVAAEAGLDTAPEYRGRGYAPRVTAAWAAAIRSSGRVPLYSTSWANRASLAVARKLALITYASDWTLTD